MKYAWLLLLAASLVFECFGDVFVKKYSLSARREFFVLCFLSYNLMLVFWFLTIRQCKMITLAGTIWLLGGQVALVLVGIGFFGERLSGVQWVGVALSGLALFLLSV